MNRLEKPFKASLKYSRERAFEAFRALCPNAHRQFASAKAPRTYCQYLSSFGLYQKWCDERGLAPMPAPPAQVRDYVVHLLDAGRAPATVTAYLAAIVTVHRLNDHAAPDLDLTVEHLKCARREIRKYRRRAKPMTRDYLLKLIARFEPSRMRDARDAAILIVGYSAALRSSETAGLDWQISGGRAQGCTGFITEERRGLQVTLITSKASQTEEVSIPVPHIDMPLARAWVERWIAAAGVQAGEPLFRPIDRNGCVMRARLTAESVASIIKRRVLEHELAMGRHPNFAYRLAAEYSGHSLRRGYCSTATADSVPLGLIRAHSRHSSIAAFNAYVEDSETWERSGLRKFK